VLSIVGIIPKGKARLATSLLLLLHANYDHFQKPQMWVNRRFALARVPASRLQPRIATHIAALAEAVRILERQQECQRDQRAYSLDLLQQCQPQGLEVAKCMVLNGRPLFSYG
jgi:hypothetical protein